MADTAVADKAWTDITIDGVEGRYCVVDGVIHIAYRDHEKTLGPSGFSGLLANAAAEGVARVALGELIAEVGVK